MAQLDSVRVTGTTQRLEREDSKELISSSTLNVTVVLIKNTFQKHLMMSSGTVNEPGWLIYSGLKFSRENLRKL